MSGMGTCPPVKPNSQSGKVSAKPSHAIQSRGLSPQVSAHLLPVFTGTRFAATRAVGVCCNRSFCVTGALLRAGAGIPRPLYAQTHSGKTLSIICALAGNIFFNKKTFPPTPFQKNFVLQRSNSKEATCTCPLAGQAYTLLQAYTGNGLQAGKVIMISSPPSGF